MLAKLYDPCRFVNLRLLCFQFSMNDPNGTEKNAAKALTYRRGYSFPEFSIPT
jgi:hypothetical protein